MAHIDCYLAPVPRAKRAACEALQDHGALAVTESWLDEDAFARVQAVLDFLELFSTSFEDYRRLPPQTLRKMLKSGGKVARFIPGAKERP